MLSLLGVPLFVQPSTQRGLDALTVYLITETDYDVVTRNKIREHIAHEGTLAGLVDRGLLWPSDEAMAEQVYVDALPEVPGFCDTLEPAPGDDPGVWTDLDSFEDALEAAERRQLATTFDSLPEWIDPPPVSGGSPDDDFPRPWRSAAELAEWTRRTLGGEK